MLSNQHCTEISTPTNDGSGYTLGSGHVLTAWHVVNDVNKNSKITIVWRNAPKVKGKSPSIKASRKDIVWLNKELDLALIRCSIPDLDESFPEAKAIIAATASSDESASWLSKGYLGSIEDRQQNRQFHDPTGSVDTIIPHKPHAKLKISTGRMDKADYWAGFSGSPVFINHKLAAVVVDSTEGFRGGSLNVALLASALNVQGGKEKKTLAEHLGIDLNEDYIEAIQGWFRPLFLQNMEQSDAIKDAAVPIYQSLNPQANVFSLDQLVDVLIENGPSERSTDYVRELYQSQARKLHDTDRSMLQDLASLMMCLAFSRQDAQESIQKARSRGDKIIKSGTADNLDTEVVLATDNHSAPEIKYSAGKVSFPYNVSPKHQRSGLRGAHGQAVEDMVNHLALKSVAGPSKVVIRNMWSEIFEGASAGDLVAKQHVEEKLKSVAKRISKKKRPFHVLLSSDASPEEEKEWATLKKWFTHLDLIKLTEHPIAEVVEYVSELEQIILQIQKDQSGGK